MILAFDVGNTFAKWGFVHAGEVVAGGRALHRGRGLAAALAGFHPDRRPASVVAVNVAGPEADAVLAGFVRERFGLPLTRVDAAAPHPKVTSLYRDRLGADRWAAAVGGFLAYGACVVADLGTAATVDAVGADGVHRGGYIVPGVDAMRAALAAGTHGVQVEDVEVAPGAWGTDTASGVAAGARRALAALVAAAAADPATSSATLLLTGGDAARVGPWIGVPHRIDHDLVIRGAVALAASAVEAPR